MTEVTYKATPEARGLVPRLEIRPRILRDTIFSVAASAFLIALSLLLIFYVEGQVALGVGLFGLVFFGASVIWILWVTIARYLKRPVSLTLTHAGLEVSMVAGTAFIPWNDVSEVGVVTISSTSLLGLQLSSYDQYLSSLTPEMLGGWKQAFGNALTRLTGAPISWDSPETRKLWSRLSGSADPGRALRDLGGVGLHAETMFITRQALGFDLTIAPSDFDRPAPDRGYLLEAYRQKM